MLIKSLSLSSPRTVRLSPGKQSLGTASRPSCPCVIPQRQQWEQRTRVRLKLQHSVRFHAGCSSNIDIVHHLLHSICQPFLPELVS